MNKLKINKELYFLSNISKAIDDYKNLATINLIQDQKYYILDFMNCKFDSLITINEFENYLIDMANNRGN